MLVKTHAGFMDKQIYKPASLFEMAMRHKNKLTFINPGRMICVIITTHKFGKIFSIVGGMQVPYHLCFLDSARFCGLGFHSMRA